MNVKYRGEEWEVVHATGSILHKGKNYVLRRFIEGENYPVAVVADKRECVEIKDVKA